MYPSDISFSSSSGSEAAAGAGDDRRQLVDTPPEASNVPGADSRRFEDPRDAHGRVVEEEPMRLFAVVAERLTMIGRDADRRRVPEPRNAQEPEKSAHRGVCGRDLSGVAAAPIRRVRLEQVN